MLLERKNEDLVAKVDKLQIELDENLGKDNYDMGESEEVEKLKKDAASLRR